MYILIKKKSTIFCVLNKQVKPRMGKQGIWNFKLGWPALFNIKKLILMTKSMFVTKSD